MTWPAGQGIWLVAVVLGVLWFINLFNFMDGIDGIAASQAVVFGFGVLVLAGPTEPWMESLIWLMTGSCIAFLLYNWNPARIFMGDAGALLLGLCLPLIALALHLTGQLPLIASMLLLTVFVFDATYTLCVRIVTGQPFTQAHKSHLYQRMAGVYGHARTTTAFVLYATVYLLPLAWLATQLPQLGVWLLIPAVLPLVWLAIWSGAGRPDKVIPVTGASDTDVTT
jgi:Fuc2NAc and GlcNAc transferase